MNAVVPYVARPLTKEEQLAHIFGEVASGRSLASVLDDDDDMPTPRQFWLWHMNEPDVRRELARARENGVEALIEKARRVAENPIEAVELVEEVGPDGVKRRRTIKDALGHRRLIIDTYHRQAQMIKPKTYGPKLDVTSDGEKIASLAEAIAAGNRRIEQQERGE